MHTVTPYRVPYTHVTYRIMLEGVDASRIPIRAPCKYTYRSSVSYRLIDRAPRSHQGVPLHPTTSSRGVSPHTGPPCHGALLQPRPTLLEDGMSSCSRCRFAPPGPNPPNKPTPQNLAPIIPRPQNLAPIITQTSKPSTYYYPHLKT